MCVPTHKTHLETHVQFLKSDALYIFFTDISFLFQLELQRNEVIALMNLLNRLSESVKFVHDMSPAAERIAGGQTSPVNSFWQRIVRKH